MSLPKRFGFFSFFSDSILHTVRITLHTSRMWYYVSNGQQAGPISQEELQLKLQSELPPSTLVWKDGMAEWVKANTLTDFQTNDSIKTETVATAVGTTETTAANKDYTNPYAAPSSAGMAAGSAAELSGIPDVAIPLDIGFCIKQGWKTTTNNFGSIFLVGLVYIILCTVVEGVFSAIGSTIDGPQATQESFNFSNDDPTAAFAQNFEQADQAGPVETLLWIPSQIIQTFFGMGLCAFALALVRGQETSIGMLFSQSGSKLFKVVMASILYVLMVFIGCLFFIIPGIYLAIRFMHYQTAIVDKDLGIIDSLNYSSQLTRDNKISLFALSIVSFFIALAGLICFLVGLLWAMPTIWLAGIIAYCYMHNGEKSIVTYD